MKATLNRICLGIVCITAIAPQLASAQSSVTLYGRAVAGLAYVDKVADATTGATNSQTSVAGNHWGTSMFGFKGTEDLGGGLTTNFVLESGFNLKNGSTNGSALFNRRSYVGLSNDSWGSFRVGKNLSISNDVWYLDPTGQQTIGSATLVKGRSWNGANNVIEYSTPNLGGFSATAQLALGEQPGSSRPNRAEGVSLSYQNQNLELRAIYSARHDSNGGFTDVYNFSKETIVGGTYRVGPAKLFAAYDYITAPDAATGAPSQLKHAWVGVRYDVTPALTLIGAGYNIKSDQAAGKANLLMVGTEYNLSKRTLLYASLGALNNSNGSNLSTDIYSNLPGVNASQKTIYAGISHSF